MNEQSSALYKQKNDAFADVLATEQNEAARLQIELDALQAEEDVAINTANSHKESALQMAKKVATEELESLKEKTLQPILEQAQIKKEEAVQAVQKRALTKKAQAQEVIITHFLAL
jgi:hypothetical protein